MQCCLRQLRFSVAGFDFELQARHIPGDHYVLAHSESLGLGSLTSWHFSDVCSQFRQSLHLSVSSTRLSPVSNSVKICFVFHFWYRLNASIHLVITSIDSLVATFFPFFCCSVVGSLRGLQWLASFSDRLIRLGLKVTMHLQGCLVCKLCSTSGLNCRYLNPYIKLKLIGLAIRLYQKVWKKMNCQNFHDS